jgi:hypothetical protein
LSAGRIVGNDESRRRSVCEKRRPGRQGSLALDQSNVAGTGSLRGFLGRELHALTFAQQFEDCAADGAAMEEVLDATFIAYEPKTFVDEEACDSPGRHGRVPPMREAWDEIPGASWDRF